MNRSIAVSWVWRLLMNVLGWAGGACIFYGVIVAVTGEQFGPIERVAVPLSSFLTILGAVFTGASIYAYSPHPHKPDNFSKYCSAPLTIVAGVIALGALARSGGVSQVVVNGFSLLGIAGGLLRTQPKPLGWPR
jgi:hypothetical protein